MSKSENRHLLHPELQAEIEFGLDQSRTADDIIENLKLFYDRSDQWRAAENEIRRLRSAANQQQLPSHERLAAAVPHEVDFQYALWNSDGAAALEAARKVLAELTDEGLRGYRGLWNYLAGSASDMMARHGATAHEAIAREYYGLASKAMPSVQWLRELAGARGAKASAADQAGQPAGALIERLEHVLDDLGTMHDQKYAAVEKQILEGLAASDAPTFEAGQKSLSWLLGFDAGKEESKGSPDPWWMIDEHLCIVFEDHSDGKPDNKFSVNKARQAASHPNWIRSKLALSEGARVLSVIVTPVSEAEDEAAIHLKEVAVWPIEQFRAWAVNAVQTVRQLRMSYPGPGDMVWRKTAMETYALAGIDPDSLVDRLKPLAGKSNFTG